METLQPFASRHSASELALPHLPADWQEVLGSALHTPWFHELWSFVESERAAGPVFPPADEVFAAFAHTPYSQVKVVLIGQDPYHDDGQAHGLCFSVKHGVAIPPSLRNMFKELHTDLGIAPTAHGNLEGWARQGVLLLNAVLTVRAHEANSHKDRGWERFTDEVIAALDRRPEPIVFALWGNYAQKKGRLVTSPHHVVLTAAHPSPLSARRFLGSRPFSAIDAALAICRHTPLDWSQR